MGYRWKERSSKAHRLEIIALDLAFEQEFCITAMTGQKGYFLVNHPVIIQGGMGAAVSGWPLAKAVAREGQLGVVSGTALDLILNRRLQMGDPEGDLRRALEAFPVPEISERIIEEYYIPGGKAENEPFRSSPIFSMNSSIPLLQLCVAANFVEVFLAKEGHQGLVGINLLAKIELPTLACLYGAMLAGVDYVIVGAGIPREIPGALDRFVNHECASMRVYVEGATSSDNYQISFDPKSVLDAPLPALKRPNFLAIVSSDTLAKALTRKSNGRVDGFVVEGSTAGGHNAPPRGRMQISEDGEPIYGHRDIPNLDIFKELGLPFWLAGSYGSPQGLVEALEVGATGIQVGTVFALCDQSGLQSSLKGSLRAKAVDEDAEVFTDPLASPTGFPFKVASLEDTLSEESVYDARPRICDLGFLRSMYRKPDRSIGYRCPAEPIEAFVSKGGKIDSTKGRKCLCNGLTANVGLAQYQKGTGYLEKPLITLGNDMTNVSCLVSNGRTSYSALDVIEYLLSECRKKDK